MSFLFARDGVDALALVEANRDIDMVVSDINMPRMDGLSLLQKLQESEQQLSTIIVSAYGDMANIRTAMNRGAFDFLIKPIDFADLETTIAKTLGISRSCGKRGSGKLTPNGRMHRCHDIFHPIWQNASPATRTESAWPGSGVRLRLFSPTSRLHHTCRNDRAERAGRAAQRLSRWHDIHRLYP